MDKNKTKYKNMFFKNSIHFLDSARKKALLMCESKLVHMSPRSPETGSRAPEGKETGNNIPEKNRKAIKKLQEEMKKGEKYKEGFEKYIGNHEIKKTYKEKLTRQDAISAGPEMIKLIAKTLPPKIRKTKNLGKFALALSEDISRSTEKHLSTINQYIPVNIQVGPGSYLEFYNDTKGFSLRLDLKVDSPRLSLIQRQIDELKRPITKKEKGKEKVKVASKGKLTFIKENIKDTQLFDQSKSKYLKKQGNIYVVDFKKGKRIDRKAEHDTHIQDLLDLSRLKGGNMYVRIYIDGVSPAGVKHKYWAYYHPSQETFIQEGTTKRALVFHGTKISQIQYKVSKPKVAKMPKVAPKAKEVPQVSETKRRLDRRFKIQQTNWDSFYGKEIPVLENTRMHVPSFLQDDGDFEKNWGRVGRPLEATLTRAPFNLKTTEARRKYIQAVIQGEGIGAGFDLNSRLYAQDFFETKVNGKDLYKGGYKKFIKDFHTVDQKMAELGMDHNNPKNEEERKLAKRWMKLQSIAFGIARIFDALGRLSLHKKAPETNIDRFRTKTLGLKQLSSKELEKLGHLEYYSMDSLLHKKDNAPAGINIGINSDLTTEIKGQLIDQKIDGLNIGPLIKAKGGLKVMFMAFGLNNLIKKGCIKRLDNTHYVVVKIPTTGWAEALGTLANNKAKLHDDSADNFKKWEEIRASLDNGRQARNFISKIFKISNSEVSQNLNWWKKLWHWDFKNKKKLTMAYAGKATLNPKDFEKHFASDRGYYDMLEKSSKRVKGTTLYEPQKAEVLKLSNRYLEFGLISTFMNGQPKGLKKFIDKLIKKEFDSEVTKLEKRLKFDQFDYTDDFAYAINAENYKKYLKDPKKYEKYKKYKKDYEKAEKLLTYRKEKLEIQKRLIAKYKDKIEKERKKLLKKDLDEKASIIIKEFGLEGKVTLKPFTSQENIMANIKSLYEVISLKGFDPSKLSKAHVRLIQIGAVVGRQVETAKNWSDAMSKHLSTRPLYRKAQLEALRNGCPIYKLKEIEQRIHVAIFGLSQSMTADGVTKFRMKGGGVGAAIDLGSWAGGKKYLNIALAASDGTPVPWVGLSGTIKKWGSVKLTASIGTSVGFTGGSIGLEFPITSEWDMFASAGVGVSWKGGKVGAGLAIGARWNKVRAERLKETTALSERGVDSIDIALSSGNNDEAVRLMLKNPTFGAAVKSIRDKFKTSSNPQGLPNSVLVEIYENARTEWLNAARRGVEIPFVTGFGVGVFAGLSTNPLESGVSFGAYVTITIPGTKVNFVIRHEHPKYSEYVQSQVAQNVLEKKLRAKSSGKNVVSSFTLSANTGIVYFDSRLGRGHVARPNGTSEMKQAVAVKDKEESANLSGKGSFAAIKQTFRNLDMHVAMVQDPKNPKNKLLAITPLRTEGSNVETLIDPELKSKGIILDKANNRILLAASEAKKLYITRTKYRYPFARKGAMNLEVISFKNNPSRSNIEIREDSPRYIYKYQGEKYAMVRGEARTGLRAENSNTMTLEQYKGRKAQYESFTDRKLEFSYKEGRNMTGRMAEAVGYSEQPPTRFNQLKLGSFADRVLRINKKFFEKGVASADTPAKEAAWKMKFFAKLKAEFKGYSKAELKNANLQLNDQELNLIYTYMLNQSFLALQHRSDAVINNRIEKRNKLFRAYMKKYVGEFAQRNPEQWKAIQAIDPSVTPDSIANYLMLTMPQNAKQFKAFLKGKSLPIGEGLKFASYTQKWKKEAFGMSYGTQMPTNFADIFKMVNPTRLNLNSPNPRERAAARLILQTMSPLSTKNLENVDGKKKFLESELSLLLITMYDTKSGISPMIEVLGKKNYQGMVAIYKGLKEGKLAAAINAHPQAFDQFKTLVMGVRAAQLNADPTYVFKNKYIFHLKQTEVYAGAYLKCGNGTIAARQRIGLSVRREQTGQWYGARTARNISVIPNERAKAAQGTIGFAHTFKSKPETGKDNPPDDKEPPKENVQSDAGQENVQDSPQGTATDF